MDPASSAPTPDEQQRITQQMIAHHGGPAFVRRAKRVEDDDRRLTDRLEVQRGEMLEMVRLRVGQARALAGDWPALLPLLAGPADLAEMQALHADLRPRLRMPLEPTTSQRALRRAVVELVEAIEAFNRRWQKLLSELDLDDINQARHAYNRYYLVEKECALGSAVVARQAFHKLPEVTAESLLARFPLLPVPQIAG